MNQTITINANSEAFTVDGPFIETNSAVGLLSMDSVVNITPVSMMKPQDKGAFIFGFGIVTTGGQINIQTTVKYEMLDTAPAVGHDNNRFTLKFDKLKPNIKKVRFHCTDMLFDVKDGMIVDFEKVVSLQMMKTHRENTVACIREYKCGNQCD